MGMQRRRLTVFFSGCPNRPAFFASTPIGPQSDLAMVEARMVRQVIESSCPVTGQRFSPGQHTHSSVDEDSYGS